MSTKNKLLSILLLILIGIIAFFTFFIFLPAIFVPNDTPPTTQSVSNPVVTASLPPKSSADANVKQVKSTDDSSNNNSTTPIVRPVKPDDTISTNTSSDDNSTKLEVKSTSSKTTTYDDYSSKYDDASSNYHKSSANKSVHHTSAPPQTGETGTIHFDSHTKEVILHSSPRSHTNIIEHLEDGTTVSILGKDRAYYHVSVDGETGYVYDRYVDLN